MNEPNSPPPRAEGLLPCPWCGHEPMVSPSGDGRGTMLDCINPHCPVQPHVSYYGSGVAVKKWNQRHAPAASPAQEADLADDDETLAREFASATAAIFRAKRGDPMRPLENVAYHAAKFALSRRVRRLRAPEQREGWTTVTDDPETWPLARGDARVAYVCKGADGIDDYGTDWPEELRSEIARGLWTKHPDLRWTALPPWPTPPGGGQGERPSPRVGAQEDGRDDSTVLIWSNEHSMWWAPNSHGYTKNRSKAGLYARAEAEVIVELANKHLPDGANPYECIVPALQSDRLRATRQAGEPQPRAAGAGETP